MAGDIVFYPIASNPAPVIITGFVNPPVPLAYTDVIHASHGVDITIKDSTIQGGSEDCVDANNDSDTILIENVRVHPNGKYGFTIKGGTKNVILRNVAFETHGSEVDIDLGNWSDQDSKNKTINVTLEDVTSLDGKPVKVRVFYAAIPTVIGGNVKLVVYPGWLVWLIRKFHNYI